MEIVSKKKKWTENPFASAKTNLKLQAIFFLVSFFISVIAFGQSESSGKKVTQFSQSWFSVNSILHFSNQWGMIGDIHVRRDNFMEDDYFYFVRAGAIYWIADKYPVILGVAHLWQTPPAGKHTWGNENRTYQQWYSIQKQGIVLVLNRIRFEQRWRDQIVNDQVVGNKLLTLRLRYLASFEIKPFRNQKIPALVVSDEACVQFGKSIIYNAFDQNRFFLGLKQSLSPELSFDIGYMTILQQKPSGCQYTRSDVFRLFFYYNLDFRRNRHEPVHG